MNPAGTLQARKQNNTNPTVSQAATQRRTVRTSSRSLRNTRRRAHRAVSNRQTIKCPGTTAERPGRTFWFRDDGKSTRQSRTWQEHRHPTKRVPWITHFRPVMPRSKLSTSFPGRHDQQGCEGRDAGDDLQRMAFLRTSRRQPGVFGVPASTNANGSMTATITQAASVLRTAALSLAATSPAVVIGKVAVNGETP